MLILIAYILGYLTAYLEFHGASAGAALAGLSSMGIFMLRILGGEMLHPVAKRLYRWGKRKTRLDRVFEWGGHFWFDHPGGKRGCDFCPAKKVPGA